MPLQQARVNIFSFQELSALLKKYTRENINGIISSGGTSNTLVLLRVMTDIDIPADWKNIFVICVNPEDYP